MTHPNSPALRRLLLASLLPLALGAGLAQANTYAPMPSESLLLAQHTDGDTHAEGEDHGSGGKHGAGGQGQGQRKRLGKGAGTGEARGGHSSESDIFRDEGFDKGPPPGKGEDNASGDDHDHEV